MKERIIILGSAAGVALIAVIFGFVFFLVKPTVSADPLCSGSKDPNCGKVISAPKTYEEKPTPVKTKPTRHPALDASDVTTAFNLAQPDDTQNEMDQGTLLFTAWSIQNLKWNDVFIQKDETTFAQVMKDPDEERGRRACFSGSIISIETVKVDMGKFYSGLLMTGARNVVSFYAVKSTGNLVERSPARICGFVTGKDSYSNSGGGTTHSVRVVGIFDLPENKK